MDKQFVYKKFSQKSFLGQGRFRQFRNLLWLYNSHLLEALGQVRGQFDKARVTWESKERELEVQAVQKSFAAVENECKRCIMLWKAASTNPMCQSEDLQVLVRTRDRLVTSLKNEIELVAESWEVKHLGKLWLQATWDLLDTLFGCL